jgi:hypothetical protein
MVVTSGPDLQAVLDELSNEIDWLVRWSYLLTLRACKTCPPLELAEQARFHSPTRWTSPEMEIKPR